MDNEFDDDQDSEALVPRTHAVFGLKVATEDEARTVRNVSQASILLIMICVFHFIVHLWHGASIISGLFHVMIPAALPSLGFYAVRHRDPKAVYFFHAGTCFFVLLHTIVLCIVVSFLFQGDLGDASCFLHHCDSRKGNTGSAQMLLWWFFMSLPTYGLCMYSAFHSLEFYVQLRITRLSGRIDPAGPEGAIVFERGAEIQNEPAE